MFKLMSLGFSEPPTLRCLNHLCVFRTAFFLSFSYVSQEKQNVLNSEIRHAGTSSLRIGIRSRKATPTLLSCLIMRGPERSRLKLSRTASKMLRKRVLANPFGSLTLISPTSRRQSWGLTVCGCEHHGSLFNFRTLEPWILVWILSTCKSHTWNNTF